MAYGPSLQAPISNGEEVGLGVRLFAYPRAKTKTLRPTQNSPRRQSERQQIGVRHNNTHFTFHLIIEENITNQAVA